MEKQHETLLLPLRLELWMGLEHYDAALNAFNHIFNNYVTRVEIHREMFPIYKLEEVLDRTTITYFIKDQIYHEVLPKREVIPVEMETSLKQFLNSLGNLLYTKDELLHGSITLTLELDPVHDKDDIRLHVDSHYYEKIQRPKGNFMADRS